MLWWKSRGRSRLSTSASRAIGGARTVLVSPITFWEVATLVRLERVALDRDVRRWVRDLLAEARVEEAELSSVAAADAGLFGDAFVGDPADRILYATARELRVPLVSKDRRMREHGARAGDVPVVW